MVLRHRTSRSSKLYDVLLLTIVCIIIVLNFLQSRLISAGASRSAIPSPPSLLRRNSLASVKFSKKKKKRRPRNVNATYCKSSAVACYNCSYSNHSYHQLPKIPQFIIVGAQKSGTTALYEFLKEHPQVRGSIVPETHFFDWYFPNGPEERKRFFREHKLSNNTTTQHQDELQCAIRTAYSDSFDWATAVSPGGDDVHQNSTIFVEKTPSYLFLPEIPDRISTTCFWKPKMIVVLRNPIDRALSHYKMRILVKGRSFEKIIDEEMESLRNLGLSQAPLRLESNITFQDPRFDELPNLSLKELKEKHWKHYRKMFTSNYLQRGMYIVQLRRWMEYFELHTSLHVINYERFLFNPSQVYYELLDFMGLPPFLPNFAYHNVAKYQPRHQLNPRTRQYISAFFRPYNRMLADQLGNEWDGVWDE